MGNTTDATDGAGTTFPYGALAFNPPQYLVRKF